MSYELQTYSPDSNTPTGDKTQYFVQRDATVSQASISPASGNFNETQAINSRVQKVETGWMPWILRPWALAAFLAFEVGIFFTIIGLYVRSNRENGLSTEVESRHYLWTYGPTAVFIIFAAFWRHLDYHVKQQMPWVELADGPKVAKLTVMLDYISPFQPVAFWLACKNKHWLVIMSAVGFAALKIATIFATGLFILQGTEMLIDSPNLLRYADQFSGANYNGSAVDSMPSFTVIGASILNLTWPAGTNIRHAFQSFQIGDRTPFGGITSLSVPADVFSATLNCQLAQLTWTDGRQIGVGMTGASQIYNSTASVPGCTLRGLILDSPPWLGDSPQKGYDGRVQNSTCEEIDDPAKAGRLVVAMTYSTRFNFTNTLENYTVLVCDPTYTIQRSQITLNGNNPNSFAQVSEVHPLGDNYTLPEVTGSDLTEGLLASLSQTLEQLTLSEWDRSLDPFFSMMLMLRPALNYTDFMDPEIMKSAALETYSAITAQIAKSSLTQPLSDDIPIDAHVVHFQQRLILRFLSVIIMEIIILILIAITVAFLIMLPRRGVAPRDPTCIGALATILSRSTALERSLYGTSNLSEKDLDHCLRRYQFYSTVENSANGKTFKVELVNLSGTENKGDHGFENVNIVDKKHAWWKPLGFKWWVIAPLIIFPLTIIVVLEILYRRSESQNGLAVIPDGGYVHYTWVYIPALTMVILVTLFNLVDYTTRSVAPYQAMRNKSEIASRGILYNPAGKLTLPALWHAIKQRHVTVIATTFAVLIAPVLTIAVSGLFFSRLVGRIETLSIQQTSWFNGDTSDTYSVNKTDNIISGLIVTSNLSYPTWTYEDLVFPELAVPETSRDDAADSVTLEVPVIRPSLNCTVLPRERYLELQLGQSGIDDSFYEDDPAGVPVWVNISMPGSCGNMGWIWTNETYFGVTLEHPKTGYFGEIQQLSGDQGPDGDRCPDFAVLYGKISNNKIQNVTTLFCNGWIQTLDTKATFLLPNFTLDASSPSKQPQRLENTARWFSNQLIYPQNTFQNLKPKVETVDILDDFLTAVVYGIHGTPLSELENPEKLVEGVSRLYGITATQTLAQEARIPLESAENTTSAGALNPMITGSSMTKPQAKLMQSEESTRVLQVLLGFIMVMTIVVYIGVRAKELLPRESNSIASIGGYLAGSDVLRLVPEGAEWKGNGREGSDWFQGYMFGFGWWEDSERGEGYQRYGVGIGKSG